MRVLVVCEKNDAAKQIAKALSDGTAKASKAGVPTYQFQDGAETYVVVGLRGHVVELDFVKGHSRWSIQPDKLHALIDADVQKEVTEPKIVERLRDEAKRAEHIIVATDYDREGELIGVEALQALGDLIEGKKVSRAKYSSFTKKEVKAAFAKLQEVDYKLAQAGEARQVIDLAWGAALTRYLSITGGQRGRSFLSVGRVQTPTLGLIVDREKERLAFVQDAYWEVEAELGDEPRFTGRHKKSGFGQRDGAFSLEGRFQSLQEAKAAAAAITDARQAVVTGVETKTRKVAAPPPFSTTSFQAECASQLGLGVKRAMDIAQKLYLNGLISYHRTENTVYPATLDLEEILAMLASGQLAKDAEWVRANRREMPTRGKKETTDHPPIYPTGVPGNLPGPELRVWELVARRFLATLSPDARLENVAADLDAGGEPLRATGQTTLEPGYRQVYPYAQAKEDPLPPLREGTKVRVHDARVEAKMTQPPKRYGQGGLIARMEELGIGTKATRHETIQKLIDRNYITEDPVQPTPLAFAVTDALEAHARTITQPDMTHRLEEEMDDIEKGTRTLDATLAESREMLHGVIDTLILHKEPIQAAVRGALDAQNHAGTCPSCGKDLLVRSNRFGGRFIGCKGYPDCRQTYNLPPRGEATFREEPCDACGAPFVTVKERGRTTELCVNAECETRKAVELEEQQEIGPCPTCKRGRLQVARSRNFKRFVKCDDEGCDQTYPLPQRGGIEPEDAACQTCRSPRVKVITKGRPPWEICINMECASNERKRPARPKAGAKGAKAAKKGTTKRATSAAKRGGKTSKPAAKGAKRTAASARDEADEADEADDA